MLVSSTRDLWKHVEGKEKVAGVAVIQSIVIPHLIMQTSSRSHHNPHIIQAS
jgi:hypothetical protein